jgi:hypothetical protein
MLVGLVVGGGGVTTVQVQSATGHLKPSTSLDMLMAASTFSSFMCAGSGSCAACHTSHATRHTSHVTRHTSPVTRHTSPAPKYHQRYRHHSAAAQPAPQPAKREPECSIKRSGAPLRSHPRQTSRLLTKRGIHYNQYAVAKYARAPFVSIPTSAHALCLNATYMHKASQ